MNKPFNRHGDYLWLVGILLIALANVRLFTTRVAVRWDAFDEMWTYFRWLGSSLRQGYFPDYFPNIMAGYPIGSNIQAGTYNIFYLTFAYAFPDSVLSINLVYLITQMAIFGLGYAIGKSYELSALSRIYLGLTLTASGFVIGHASHFSYLATACGLLGCFLGLRMALLNRGPAAFSLLFVSVYHMFTAGYPANILFGAQCLLAYWIYLFITVASSRRTLLTAAAGAIGGVLVSAPAIWHFLNLLQQSKRGDGLDIDTVMSGSLPLYGILNYFLPLWKMRFSDPSMERFHLLLISAPLAVYAVWNTVSAERDRKRILVLFSLALILLLLALGRNSPIPLRLWLAEHFFIYRTGRFPSGEHRGIALFLLALISAFGLQWMQERWPKKKKALLIMIMLDFLIVMHHLKGVRYGRISEKYQGSVALFQTHFDAGSQAFLDKVRDCTPDGKAWTFTAIGIQRDHLAPANFYWNGYVGLRDQIYDLERDKSADILCGPSRLWQADNHTPRSYQLVTYTPGYIKLRISGDSGKNQLIWADYNDSFWNLKINGQPSPLAYGPARLRTFTAASDDIIEMTYAGPLSRLWR
jgi:hypothetical protein